MSAIGGRIFGPLLAMLLLFTGAARADDVSLAPGKATKALQTLRYFCWSSQLCPMSSENYDTFKRAVEGQRDSEYLFGLNLLSGDGVQSDREAGMQWIVLAAEQGAPLAARYVENHLQNGEHIEVDETKVANALKVQADKGDVASMMALAPMMIRGRGTAQDAEGGMAMLIKAAEHSQGGNVEYLIAELLLIGTNGLPKDREKAMEWYARAASRGYVRAMATLGSLWENEPTMDVSELMRTGRIPEQKFKRNILNSVCWRLRAALLGDPSSQYELALQLSRESSDSFGNEFQPDLLEADYWFRLGAQDREYDNSQVRGYIEPKMTTAQLDEVKKRVAAFRKMSFEEMKAAAIPVPVEPGRNCPAMPVF